MEAVNESKKIKEKINNEKRKLPTLNNYARFLVIASKLRPTVTIMIL